MRICNPFRWKVNDIITALPSIKNQGFEAIQLSPLQTGKFVNIGDEWWKLYQVYGLSIGNALGTEEDLKNLCKAAESYNLRIILDVVLNHVASKDDDNLKPHDNVDSFLLSNEHFFKENVVIKNWENRWEITNYSIGLPSLRLENHELQDKIIEFLNHLIDCGVSGFRIDAGKHIKLPEEGSDFFTRVFSNLKKKGLFNYAEVIFSPQEIIDTYSKYINVLTDSYGSEKNKIVTYIDNHDLEKEFKVTERISSDSIVHEYKRICGMYKNTMFYMREFDDTWLREEVREGNIINIT